MPFSKPNSALIIIGHGSTLNPDSSAPTHQHADAIRAQGIFAEVVCAFWKEEPSMTEVFEMVESREIYIVPNFISEGYFCQQVLPRELRLTGPTTERDGRVIHYCAPVGIHPNMTRLLMQRADEVAPGVPRDQTSLIIVGHGTNLNENSTKAIQDQVKLIREGGYGFAEVLDTYMEEAPFVADWHKLTTTPNVIVVPFFIADGLHSFQDIPVLLGIESEVGAAASECEIFRQNPISMHGRSLYYSSAIGTEAHMADVILDQVEDFDRKHGERPPERNHSLTPALSQEEREHDRAPEPARDSEDSPSIGNSSGSLSRGERAGVRGKTVAALKRWLDAGLDTIGQVRITQNASGTFSLHHTDDTSLPSAPSGTSPFDAREIARSDGQGKFRPLKSAPTLNCGWLLELRTIEEVRLALDFLYPAALGMALEHERGTLIPVSLREMLGRQTGMYRFARTIQDDAALEMIASNCDTATKCTRRILWDLAPNQPLTGNAAAKAKAGPHEAASIPLLCMEACCHVLSESRRIAKAAHEAAGQRADG